MKKTVICHFRDEEYLLPFFLKHHRTIFDHGIMIDYHSTDNSCAIIKELCPHWDIITSRNVNFQADNIDYEVMDIEKDIDGWRICLNVTEFLQGDISLLNDTENQQLILPSIFFVDTNIEQLVDSRPLWEQKTDGFSFVTDFAERRGRSIHNIPIQYPIPGRHYPSYTTDQLVIFYYGWAPLDDKALARKLQIQTQIPLIDRQRNFGFHHITNKETLMYRLETEFMPRVKNLKQEVDYYVSKHISNIL